MFQTIEEKNIFKNYIKKGFLIFNIKNTKKLDYIRSEVVNNLKNTLSFESNTKVLP